MIEAYFALQLFYDIAGWVIGIGSFLVLIIMILIENWRMK